MEYGYMLVLNYITIQIVRVYGHMSINIYPIHTCFI